MAKTNVREKKPAALNHEGVKASRPRSDIGELRRAVMSCLLWENQFYESGQEIADRICKLIAGIDDVEAISALAEEARTKFNLRHVPLLVMSALLENGKKPNRRQIASVIRRPDEMGELISIFWRKGKKPLSKQMKLGLSDALHTFNEYSLAKYNSGRAAIKLKDVIRLVHPKPADTEKSELFKKIVDGTLESPDTWEVALSGGADKKETFTRLLQEGKLGYLALLRNLRNMSQAKVDKRMVEREIRARQRGADKVFPFRFVAAARAAPEYASSLDVAMRESVAELPTFYGKTIILVDVSGSMESQISAKSDLTRMDAAAALAAIFPGEEVEITTFSSRHVKVKDAHGLQGIQKIVSSQPHSGTNLAGAIQSVNHLRYDRLVVITDEQYTGTPPEAPNKGSWNYIINVGSYKNGVSYSDWIKIDGFSESVFRFMWEIENSD